MRIPAIGPRTVKLLEQTSNDVVSVAWPGGVIPGVLSQKMNTSWLLTGIKVNIKVKYVISHGLQNIGQTAFYILDYRVKPSSASF